MMGAPSATVPERGRGKEGKREREREREYDKHGALGHAFKEHCSR